jgi:hypothetical protein
VFDDRAGNVNPQHPPHEKQGDDGHHHVANPLTYGLGLGAVGHTATGRCRRHRDLLEGRFGPMSESATPISIIALAHTERFQRPELEAN